MAKRNSITYNMAVKKLAEGRIANLGVFDSSLVLSQLFGMSKPKALDDLIIQKKRLGF